MSDVPLVIITRREWDVLDALLDKGGTNKQIGKKLYLTEDTVKTHMAHLMHKTGTVSRTELVVLIMRDRVRLAFDPGTPIQKKETDNAQEPRVLSPARQWPTQGDVQLSLDEATRRPVRISREP